MKRRHNENPGKSVIRSLFSNLLSFSSPPSLPSPCDSTGQQVREGILHTDSMLHSRTQHSSRRPHSTHGLSIRLHASMASGAPIQYRVRAASLSSQHSRQAAAGVSLQHGQELDDAFSGLDTAGSGRMTVAGFGSLLSQRSARTTFPDLQNFRPGRVRDKAAEQLHTPQTNSLSSC